MKDSEEKVILVDASDNQIGIMDKMEAHEKGILHRAFSVFIFDDKNNLILQQRALDKYHSPGLWTNTCCSHPRENEAVEVAAHRRLREEMGFDTALEKAFHFIYKSEFENGLIEHEFDHVFVGKYLGEIVPDKSEVNTWRSLSISELRREIKTKPEDFTVWFKVVIEEYADRIEIG
jgi:isopentenyl-diphosphate Delta-isomerase